MKASAAVSEYITANDKRNDAWENAEHAKKHAPATYAKHLKNVLDAQDGALESLSKAQELQAKAVDAAKASQTEAEKKYGTSAVDAILKDTKREALSMK